MLRKKILENKRPVAVTAFGFLLYLVIAMQVPYMLDDWNWGSDAGIVSFLTCDQNSRFAGNLVVLLITRSVLAKNLLMAAVEAAIPVVMVQLCGYENGRDFVRKYLLCMMLLFLMPVRCWSETYGWVSGFANFVVSVLFLLIHLKLVKTFVWEKNTALSKGKTVALALFAFAGQMFIENLTVYFAAVYVCLFVFLWIRDKKIPGCIAVVLLGIVAGSALMFSSNLYGTLLTTGEAYGGLRSMSVDMNSGVFQMVMDALRTFVSEFLYEITIELHWPSSILLAVSVLLLLRKKSTFSRVLVIANVAALAGILWIWIMHVSIRYRYETLFGAGYYGLVFLNLLVIFASDRRKLLETFFLWLSVMGILAPLAVTNTAGPRLWLASLTLICLVILYLADELLRDGCLCAKKPRLQMAVLVLLLCCSVAQYMVAYASVSQTNRQRLEAIAGAVAEETGEVHLPRYDGAYTKYLHGWDPFAEGEVVVEKWVTAYKAFYGIPQDYKLYIGSAGGV